MPGFVCQLPRRGNFPKESRYSGIITKISAAKTNGINAGWCINTKALTKPNMGAMMARYAVDAHS